VQEARSFRVFFSDVKILKALWACVKELGVCVLFLKSHHYECLHFCLRNVTPWSLIPKLQLTSPIQLISKWFQYMTFFLLFNVLSTSEEWLLKSFSSTFQFSNFKCRILHGRKSCRTLEQVSFTCHHLMKLAVKLFLVCVCVCVCVYTKF
jgi:hypothetical protein